MALLRVKNEPTEGQIFIKWLESRFNSNKNVLGAETGGTGSGKSYRDLRKAELWYAYKFKEKFPIKNICFSISEVMKRLTDPNLRRYEILIFEEAGANMGSLDFQNKVSKLFGYVLQSFRSMNIGIFFNLPYLSMLNKQARLLMHYTFESYGINPQTKMNKCKPKFNQVNQSSGKVYSKYLIVKVNGKKRKIQRMSFGLPSQYLIDGYEKKKAQFLADTTTDFKEKLVEMERDAQAKLARKDLTDRQMEVFKYLSQGFNQTQTAKKLGIPSQNVSQMAKVIKNKGYIIKKPQNPIRNHDLDHSNPDREPNKL